RRRSLRRRSRPTSYSLTLQLTPHLPGAVHLLIFAPDTADFCLQPRVAPGTLTLARGIRLLSLVLVVGRRSDRQLLADRLDSVHFALIIAERHHHLTRRSSSAWAKYADALRRISFARRSSRFSRSSSFSRWRSSVVSPGRRPWSRSVCRTQLRSVSAEQPILDATDWIAAHWELCPCSCSCTSRTARSRTSEVYCFALLM